MILTCSIDEVLPTEGTIKNYEASVLTLSILRDITTGIGIKRPLDVSRIEDYPGESMKSQLSLYAKLGFDTSKAKYLIHLGHHRWSAAVLGELKEITVCVRPASNIYPMFYFDLAEMYRQKCWIKIMNVLISSLKNQIKNSCELSHEAGIEMEWDQDFENLSQEKNLQSTGVLRAIVVENQCL